ncbi:hypothetical protein DFH08DRAFT_865453 [Mycena albidolilacea]|uniref:Uncharacterized protein n=1 Tax=Mycena albidolilacea TaxID=1033008 RepID=A0AAD7A4U1_9AGAR|nr:hypothetical protein DFH08DRAFT_865453 [Mycena albidolilacea]
MPPASPSFAPSFQPFQIIVIPPAEDEQPDILVFDTHDVPEPEVLVDEPDFASLDAALARIREDPPAVTRTSVDEVVLPRRSSEQSDLADDTIVEVVKVRRAFSPDEQPPPPPPKPKSLRSRAGSAFRSIKNLARVASRSNTRPYAQEVFASSQSTQATFAALPPPETPPRTRRGSIILTQLFRTPSPAVDTPPPTLDFAGELYSDEDDEDDDDDDRRSIPSRGPSPTPSARTFSSTVRRRLSILSFRKGRAAPPPRPASPPTLSRGSTVPSTSSLPQTPTEEEYPRLPPSTKDADDDPDRTIGEMRLDSLHFESLSFDADQF